MEPYLFEPVVAIDQSGSESASEEDLGEVIWRLANTMWYVLELLFWSLLSFIIENGINIIRCVCG